MGCINSIDYRHLIEKQNILLEIVKLVIYSDCRRDPYDLYNAKPAETTIKLRL